MGAILGGAGERNQNHLYEFGKKLGIAFQVQDDYLDAFGDPEKFGKQVGGDIYPIKKLFYCSCTGICFCKTKERIESINKNNASDKVEKVLAIFRECAIDTWAFDLKEKYINTAFKHLEDTAVLSIRKEPLKQLAYFLVQREY